MNHAQFNKLYRKFMTEEKDLVASKGIEYNATADRFANFKNMVALQLNPKTPEATAWNVMAKHLEATMRGIDDLALNTVRGEKFWNEKLGDIIIYTRIIQVMVSERHAKAFKTAEDVQVVFSLEEEGEPETK